jgi:outer membrane lipoprotein-sorting protein
MLVPGEGGEPGMTMNVTMIYDGTNYWSITPMGAMKVPANQVERQMQASAHWWNYLSERDTFAGEGQAEGRACYVVDFEPGKALSYTRIWIDKENFRLVQALGPDDGHMYRFTFSDYRDTQGMDLPFKMQMYEDNRLVGEYITRSMQFNVGLDDSLFVVNGQAGGTNIQEMMRRAMKESGEDGGQ